VLSVQYSRSAVFLGALAFLGRSPTVEYWRVEIESGKIILGRGVEWSFFATDPSRHNLGSCPVLCQSRPPIFEKGFQPLLYLDCTFVHRVHTYLAFFSLPADCLHAMQPDGPFLFILWYCATYGHSRRMHNRQEDVHPSFLQRVLEGFSSPSSGL
jgi:hypothetical protein